MTADHAGQTGDEREVCSWCFLPKSAPVHGNPFRAGHPFSPMPAAPSRPVPVPGQAASERGVSDRPDVTGDQTGQAAREAAVEAVALPRYSVLVVPVDGHAVACQGCGSLVLDNPNAIAMHSRFHLAALSAAPALSERSVSTTDALSAAGGQET